MGRKKTGLDEKLLSAADELFYAKGYTNTGISELVARAGTNKPGLYSYFQSKDEIARRYLSRRNQAMNDRIVAFGKESRSVVDFFRRWMADARDHARGAFGQYNGCAVANFALQTEIGQEEMQSFIRETGRRWQSQLVAYLRSEIRDVGDEAERASRESDNILELRTRDRYRKLLNKIDAAMKRIEDGSYGYCEETGEEIGLGRLEARPIATLTVDAQERREMLQRQFRDDR